MKEKRVNKEILETTRFDQFKLIKGNRPINDRHLGVLLKAIESRQLFTLGIVNEKNEICDGQHRFKACEKLNIPFYYTIEQGYGLDEIIALNTSSKTWGNYDYLNCFVEREDGDYPDYEEFAKFMEQYEFGFKSCIGLLTNQDSVNTEDFNQGLFKITHHRKAHKYAREILKVGKYYDRYKNWNFVMAMINLLNNKKYDHDQFLARLKSGGARRMLACTTKSDTKAMIQEIYNTRSRSKVNFFF